MLHNLQLLRAMAAIMVVIVHVGAIPRIDRAGAVAFGHAGVDLFFVLSGFVMVYTAARRPVTPGAFLRNRIVRVAPLYWSFTLLLFAVAMAGYPLMQAVMPRGSDLLHALLFLPHAKTDGTVQPIFFLGWTLNYEMAFYLLFAGALWIARGRLMRVVAGCATVLILLVLVGQAIAPTGVAAAFYTRPIIVEFGMGMVLGLATVRGQLLPVGAAWMALATGMLLLFIHPLLGIATHHPLVGLIATIALAGAVGVERGGRSLRAPMVQLLGAASYALYLSHPFAVAVADRVVARLPAMPPFPTALLVAVPLSIAIALVVHLGFERPLTAWVARRVGRTVPSTTERAEHEALARI